MAARGCELAFEASLGTEAGRGEKWIQMVFGLFSKGKVNVSLRFFNGIHNIQWFFKVSFRFSE